MYTLIKKYFIAKKKKKENLTSTGAFGKAVFLPVASAVRRTQGRPRSAVGPAVPHSPSTGRWGFGRLLFCIG